MKYTVIIKKLAEKFIVKLPKPEKERVLKAIYELPKGNDIKELKGKKNEGLYRLRVGDYRIIYSVDNGKLIVYVVDAGNRGNIYKRYRQEGIKITVSKAAQRATEKYAKENYDRILVKFPKGTKEQIQATGETVNGFINKAVAERLEKQAER